MLLLVVLLLSYIYVLTSGSRGKSWTESELPMFCVWERLWKSAVHRSAVRSNASSKFLQNYAGRRVRQPRTPNTSAERKFTNLIKLKQYRVKKTVSPSTPTCWRQAPSFRSRRNTISHRETKHNKQTTKTNKQEKRARTRRRSVLCQVMWHSSSCS